MTCDEFETWLGHGGPPEARAAAVLHAMNCQRCLRRASAEFAHDCEAPGAAVRVAEQMLADNGTGRPPYAVAADEKDGTPPRADSRRLQLEQVRSFLQKHPGGAELRAVRLHVDRQADPARILNVLKALLWNGEVKLVTGPPLTPGGAVVREWHYVPFEEHGKS
jgi:hypothetical protein